LGGKGGGFKEEAEEGWDRSFTGDSLSTKRTEIAGEINK
jgi:hypothetical protein